MSYPLPSATRAIVGSVALPGSKSATNRALLLAALATGPSEIRGALSCRDVDLMISALRKFGIEIAVEGQVLTVVPHPLRGGGTIDCGLAGTVMRFIPPLVILTDAPTAFIGDPEASARPMLGLLDGLRQLGAQVTADRLPFEVHPGELRSSEVTVDSSASSQFISALLFLGSQLPAGLTIYHRGSSLPSRPHIAMTVSMLREAGVRITEAENTWRVFPSEIRLQEQYIEPDLTNAAVFLSAALLTDGEVTIPGWPARTNQAGAQFVAVAEAFGASFRHSDSGLTIRPTQQFRGCQVDLHEASELTCVVAALAACAQGETTIRGVGHIRGHETNRLEALVAELRRASITAQELSDGLHIVGGNPKTSNFRSYGDHRMAHFAALLGLLAPGSTIDDPGCVSKTMPTFWDLWRSLL